MRIFFVNVAQKVKLIDSCAEAGIDTEDRLGYCNGDLHPLLNDLCPSFHVL
jgi:hypothetical protein